MISRLGRATALAWLAAAGLFFGACSSGDSKKTAASHTLKMATTTSTENSGLLARILPDFEKKTGIKVQVIAVGTGKAIKHGENGDVDVILVHSRPDELKFVEEGFGVDRREIMHNDFVLLGPPEDPAGVRGLANAAEALRRIAETKSPFVSRGDDSGTHKKEMSLWEAIGVKPSGDWYMAAGQGMAPCLTIADEKRAYILSDRGTYLAFKDKIDLDVLLEGDPKLFNPYGIIAVNPERYPDINYEGALKLIDWFVSEECQKMIADYKRGGERLFYPDVFPVK